MPSSRRRLPQCADRLPGGGLPSAAASVVLWLGRHRSPGRPGRPSYAPSAQAPPGCPGSQPARTPSCRTHRYPVAGLLQPAGRPRPASRLRGLIQLGTGTGSHCPDSTDLTQVRGSWKVKRLPSPGPLSTLMVPWCSSTRCLAMVRPSPVPPVALVRDGSTR